ncbi:MAG: serine hydrolase domain-containing protein [Promethearchaeota archaeon]
MEKIFTQLEHIIRNYMRKYKVPGLAISIFQEDQMIYSKGFGARDLEKFLPMTPQTLIGIGSITKSLTAFGIMILVERGQLSLDDSVSKYLDFAPFTTHPDIQIKHILSHSSGVPAADGGLASLFYTFGDYKKVYPATSREDFIAHLSEPEDFIIFKPGEKFYYNNDMFTCLGFIIEKLSKSSYSKFIRKEILDPLEMKRAVFSKEEFEKDPLNDKISGYLPKKEGDLMVPKKHPVPLYDYLNAPGGLYVSMEEMMHYTQCLLQKGKYKEKQLLSSDSIDELWTPRISCPYGFGKDPKYGLGWDLEEGYYDHTFIHHGGGLGTSCANLSLIPEKKLGVSVGQNTCTGIISVIARAALSLLLDLDPKVHVEELKTEQIIDEICGVYKSPHDLYKLKIYLKETVLFADIEIDDGFMTLPLMPYQLEDLSFYICTTLPKARQYLRFIRDQTTEKVKFAAYDRYLYQKI